MFNCENTSVICIDIQEKLVNMLSNSAEIASNATKFLKYSKGGTIGLKNAVDLLNIQTNENYHNAYYDALYTAEVFKLVKSDKIQLKIFNSKRIK